VILVYVLALKEPLPRRYVFGAAVAFGVIIGLLGVCNGLVVLRRRFCGKDEVKGGGNGDKEKGSPTSSRSGEEINGCCCCVRVGRRVGRWLVEYEEKSHKFRVWKERRARKKLGSESTYEVCDDEMKDGALFKKSFDEGAGDMMRSSVVTTRIGGAIERVEQGQPRLSFEVEGTDVGCRSRECLQSDIGATQQGIWGSGYISPRTDFYKQAGAVRASRFDQALAVSSPDTLRTQSPPSNRPTIASQNIAAAQQQRPFSGPTSMAHEDRLPHFPSPMASSREASANEQDAVSNNLKLAEGAAVQNSSLSNPLVTTPMSRMKVPNRTSSRKRVPEPHRPPEGKQQYQAPNPPPTTALPIMLSHQVKARHSQASSSAQSVSSPPATTPLPATPTPQPHYSNSTNTRPTHSLKRTSVSSETLGRGGYLLPSSTYHRQEEPRTPTSPRSKQDGPFSYFAPNDSRTPINVNHNPAFQQQQQQQTQDQRQNRILRHARHGRAKSSHGVHRNASISEVEEPPPSLSRSAPLSSPSVPAGSYEAQGYNTYFPDSAVQARAGTKRMAFK
jgi:hypothetical protein